jgi:hypothetical protein
VHLRSNHDNKPLIDGQDRPGDGAGRTDRRLGLARSIRSRWRGLYAVFAEFCHIGGGRPALVNAEVELLEAHGLGDRPAPAGILHP